MDDTGLRRRLESSAPPNLADARERAKLAARVSLSRGYVPVPNDRSASISRPRRSRRRVRNLALAAALATGAAALPIALGTGGGSGVKPEVANAADLVGLAEAAPHFEIAGGWQITDTEVSPDGGGTQFHYEREPADADGTADAEIRWHTASVEELGRGLEDEGLQAAGTQPTRTLDATDWRTGNYDTMFTSGTAQVYAAHEEGEDVFRAAGLWREGGWTLELSARVESLYMLERLLERVEILGREEWLIAIRPGGAKWLKDSLHGTVQSLENVRTERPDGTVVYEARATIKTPEQSEELDFTTPFPVIYREGDNVRVEVEHVPSEVPAG